MYNTIHGYYRPVIEYVNGILPSDLKRCRNQIIPQAVRQAVELNVYAIWKRQFSLTHDTNSNSCRLVTVPLLKLGLVFTIVLMKNKFPHGKKITLDWVCKILKVSDLNVLSSHKSLTLTHSDSM